MISKQKVEKKKLQLSLNWWDTLPSAMSAYIEMDKIWVYRAICYLSKPDSDDTKWVSVEEVNNLLEQYQFSKRYMLHIVRLLLEEEKLKGVKCEGDFIYTSAKW